MRLRRSSKFNSAKARFKGLRPFNVQNTTASQFKVLSPLSYESGRAERNALERVFYTPEGLYTRRMSLYTS